MIFILEDRLYGFVHVFMMLHEEIIYTTAFQDSVSIPLAISGSLSEIPIHVGSMNPTE